MPAVTDEISERYLRKAIEEINELWRELGTFADELHVPVHGSGHPLGDLFLLKYTPTQAEIEEGVAFFGRAGHAVLRSLQRLNVDASVVYGTNCLKFGTEDPEDARAWLTRELHIVKPRLVVVMGERAVGFLNELQFPLSRPVDPGTDGLQQLTPTVEALVTPDLDESLDEQDAKNQFWNAFKTVGAWWTDLPPY